MRRAGLAPGSLLKTPADCFRAKQAQTEQAQGHTAVGHTTPAALGIVGEGRKIIYREIAVLNRLVVNQHLQTIVQQQGTLRAKRCAKNYAWWNSKLLLFVNQRLMKWTKLALRRLE